MSPNAFINKSKPPTNAELAAALGPAKKIWDQLIGDLADECGIVDQEWNSYSPKAGWALRLKHKKRNIIYLAPCVGCFRVALILGDKAVAAARQGDLSKSTLKLLDEAPRYPEGTGLRLIVKAAKDLAAIRKLALIKLANCRLAAPMQAAVAPMRPDRASSGWRSSAAQASGRATSGRAPRPWKKRSA